MDIPFPILSQEETRIADLAVQIREQMDLLFEMIAQQEEDLREAKIMLNRANTEVMLYGKQPPPDNRANLGSLSDSDLFIVAAMDLKERSQLFGDDSTKRFPAREVELMKSAIYNVFETVLGPLSIASCCESDLCFANILINLLDKEQPEEAINNGIHAALHTAIEIVQKNYGISLYVAASPIVHGHKALPQARLAAYRILQQEQPIQEIAHVSAVPSVETVVKQTMRQTDTRLEKQYYQFILSRDFHMAKLTLKELLASDLAAKDIPFAVAKLRFLNHVESLLNISGLQRADVGFLYLRQLDSEEAIYALLEDLFQVLAEKQDENPEKVQRERLEEVAAYITEHYSDSDLCLAKLCRVFHMNQSYLSRTFKSIHSIGILDYIHTQRLIHVKELLKNPGYSIDAVWAAVGYTNRRTFSRTFRKLEGMSASEYRRNVLKQ